MRFTFNFNFQNGNKMRNFWIYSQKELMESGEYNLHQQSYLVSISKKESSTYTAIPIYQNTHPATTRSILSVFDRFNYHLFATRRKTGINNSNSNSSRKNIYNKKHE